LGFSGHKHMLSEKIVAFVDRNCNVLSPMVVAPGNRHEGPLLGRTTDVGQMRTVTIKSPDAKFALLSGPFLRNVHNPIQIER